MFRIDIYVEHPYKQGNKKVGSAWYPTLREAENARMALLSLTRLGTSNKKLVKMQNLNIRNITNPVEDCKY